MYTNACPTDDNALWWYATSEEPGVLGGPNGMWRSASSQLAGVTWHSFEAVAVQIFGDIALVYYAVTWAPELPTGTVMQIPSRRTTTFQRRGNTWLQVGGMIGYAPPASE